MAELRGALDRSFAGRGGACVLTGEPGIGKTLLARELSAEAEERGALVAWGRAWEAGGAPPLWPWVELLRALTARTSVGEIAAAAGTAVTDLAILVPELGEQGADQGGDGRDSEEARFRLFDAVATTLEHLARSQPVVLVLDDLHAGDAATILLARFVARRAPEAPLLLVSAYRAADAARRSDIASAIADLTREALPLPLSGLTREDVGTLLESILDRSPTEQTLEAVYGRTEGNPLFVHGIGRLLPAGDAAPAVSDVAIPHDIEEAIAQRLRLLSAETRDLLTTCAVVGRDFESETVALASETSPDAVRKALDEAVAVGVVAGASPDEGRRSFVHSLYQEILYRSLPAGKAAGLHARVARAIEDSHANDLTPHLATLAFHFLRGVAAGKATDAYEYSRRAGDDAMASFSFEQAARHYQQALDLIPQVGASEDDHLDLTLSLGRAQLRAAQPDHGFATLEEAAQLARSLARWRHLALIALEQAPDLTPLTWQPQRIALIEEALEAVGDRDPSLRARLLARYAIYGYYLPEESKRDAYAREAVAIARRLDDHALLGEALLASLGTFPPTPDATRQQIPVIGEALRLAKQTGDLDVEMHARLWRMASLLEQGDGPGWERERTEYDDIARRTQMPILLWYAAMFKGARAILDGDTNEAGRLAQEALELGMAAGRPEAFLLYGAQFAARIALERDWSILTPMADTYRAMAAAKPGFVPYRAAVAAVEALLGNRDYAVAELRAICADGFAGIRRDRAFVTSLMSVAEATLLSEDPESARVAYDHLRPYEDMFVAGPRGIAPSGPTAAVLGSIAALLGEYHEMDRFFEKALSITKRLASPAYTATGQSRYAEALLTRRQPGDPERATSMLQAAIPVFERLAMAAPLDHARGLLAQVPEDRSHGGVPRLRREGDYWTAGYGGTTVSIKHSKGVEYIARLVDQQGREVHALGLVGGAGDVREGGAAPILDDRAKREIRDRLRSLEEDVDEGEQFGDTERAARARAEIDKISRALSAALGLGGRDRALGSPAERARVNATRVIRAAIERIEQHHPALGDHLASTIRTGAFCSYDPSRQDMAPPDGKQPLRSTKTGVDNGSPNT